ncbi:signal peptidase I [bacterium]|nr:signal peptidase I [bacterium]
MDPRLNNQPTGPAANPPQPNPQPAAPTPAQPHVPQAPPSPPAMPNVAPLPTQPTTPNPTNTPDSDAPPSKARRFVGSFVSWVVVPIVIVLVLHTFVFQAFYVEGSSMEPGYQSNDYLIVSKLDMTFNNLSGLVGIKSNPNIKRGDVLVFHPPIAPQTFFVKRAIGLPGEKVIVKNGKVTIINEEHPNGLVLKEDYIDKNEPTLGDVSVTVEQGKYFVLGDNRRPSGSYDSRDWGLLPKENIIGVAYMRLLPVSAIGTLSRPNY